jgi:hypothetical protein
VGDVAVTEAEQVLRRRAPDRGVVDAQTAELAARHAEPDDGQVERAERGDLVVGEGDRQHDDAVDAAAAQRASRTGAAAAPGRRSRCTASCRSRAARARGDPSSTVAKNHRSSGTITPMFSARPEASDDAVADAT